MEQEKADESVLRLVQGLQREEEVVLKDFLRLGRELDEKHKLEMEIEESKGKLQVMKYLGNEDDEALQSKTKELEEQLKEKEDQWNDVKSLNQTLLIKKRQSNDELQEACKKLIKMDSSSSEQSVISDSENDVRNSSLQLASMEQKKADENVLRLLEELQREEEEALKEILRLERELHEKQKLEMEILEYKCKLQVMKHLAVEDDGALESKMKELEEELKEKEDHEARKKLIKRAKEEALKDILRLEKGLDEKQKLEMEIQELKGKLQVMKHLGNEDDEAQESKMKELEEEIEEKLIKRAKEALKDILRLEKELDEKQEMEMEIQEVKGKLQVMKHLGNEDDEALQSKMKELEEDLEEKLIKVDAR
ncbi:uncharacterized protein LOC141721799 isoform X1 [Apium graveolens]|uniref:uncharacterized protein LOC141721799 isoform X1 n=1 Tax=Apium graveolens TaxID=4045 RepID=UPI003D79F3F1